MKKLKLKKVLPVMFIGVLFITSMGLMASVTATGKFPGKKNDTIRKYVKENIFPVLREARAEFDEKLSADEKNTIADVREQLRQKHQEMRSQGDMPPPPEGEGPHRRGMIANREVADQLMDIMNAHKEELKQIHEELKPSAEKWHEDIKALHEASDDRHPRRGGFGRMMSPMHFLLMDPDREMPEPEQEPTLIEAFVSPNPGVDMNQLHLTTSKKENLRIQVLDFNGHLVKTVMDGSVDEGEHTFSVDNTDLGEGIYYYVIITPSNQQILRFIIK